MDTYPNQTQTEASLETTEIELPILFLQSPELGELFASLAKTQATMECAKADCFNPYFKSWYASLESLITAARPSLTREGLPLIQRVVTVKKGSLWLYTTLGHASGQWMESRMELYPKDNNIQDTGSHIADSRRYTYAGMTGVSSSKEEDDDGESVVVHKDKKKTVSQEQLKFLSDELEGLPDLCGNILEGFNIKRLSELPAAKYLKIIERIRDVRAAQEK